MRKPQFLPVCLLLAALCCPAAELFPVAGIVVDSGTGSPRARSPLVVLKVKSTVPVARQVTGPDGRFRFDLPVGEYNLASGLSDDPQIYGRKAPDMLIGSSIIVRPDQDNSNLVFRWIPLAAISGRVVDDAGEPVESAIVQLVRSTVVGGRRMTATAGWRHTNDRGEYRFGRLVGGVYYLAVSGRPWYTAQLARSEPEGPRPAYAKVYYPNSPDPGQAAPLTLRPGEEARVDFGLRVLPGSSIHIQIESPKPLTGYVGLTSDGIGGSDGYQEEDRIYGASHFMEAVPPGHYRVRLNAEMGKTPMSGETAIDVSGSQVEVKVTAKPNPSVSGTVQLKNPQSQPHGSILAGLVFEDTGRALATAVHPDGTFLFPNVVPDKYRIAVRGTDGYFASEVHVDGAAYANGVVDLIAGESVTIRIVASDEIGRVRGYVMDGERPVVGALVVLAPASGGDDWQQYRGFQTDSDGSYDFTNVPGGDYLLFAVEDVGLEYTNPDVLRRYAPSAKRIHLAPHDTVSASLSICVAAAESR